MIPSEVPSLSFYLQTGSLPPALGERGQPLGRPSGRAFPPPSPGLRNLLLPPQIPNPASQETAAIHRREVGRVWPLHQFRETESAGPLPRLEEALGSLPPAPGGQRRLSNVKGGGLEAEKDTGA